MTSITNYESVVLPIKNEEIKKKKNILNFFKDFKNKKFQLSIKKKHIAVTAMVFMLSGAVYVNYLYAAGEIGKTNETGKNYGDSILVEGEASEEINKTAAYFSEARIAKQQSRDEAVATLRNLYGDAEYDSEEVSVLAEKADTIAANMELENKIESMIKAKGFRDCIVYISGDYADVMVSTDELLPTEAALIKETIIQETSVPVENISIIEVNS
ncbi:MAG: SpoIIIAH-like family protein [Oscillospiraceae bacterium]|nr:SpoIIIAH-like family protein [Oscillospiraceae bacterium]